MLMRQKMCNENQPVGAFNYHLQPLEGGLADVDCSHLVSGGSSDRSKGYLQKAKA